jgi:quercetin dioxygenase-like cupin family protein
VIVKGKSKGYVDVMPGVRRKTLAVGEKGLMGEFVLEAGAILPQHSHPLSKSGIW